MTGIYHTDRLQDALDRLNTHTLLFGTPTRVRAAFELVQQHCSLALAAPHSTVLLGHNQDVTLWDVPGARVLTSLRANCCTG